MEKQYIIYGDTISITSTIISEDVVYAYTKKIIGFKENENFERFLCDNILYEKLQNYEYLYIFSEIIENAPIIRNHKFINDMEIGFYDPSKYLIFNQKYYFDIDQIVSSFEEIQNNIYIENYYIYDSFSKLYYVPTKETLKNDIFKSKIMVNQNICIDRNYIDKYYIKTKTKPENIFELFQITKDNE